MVLNLRSIRARRALFSLALGVTALVISPGCIKELPQVRFTEATPIALAVVVDQTQARAVLQAPDPVIQRITAVLAERNLVVVDVPFEGIKDAFEAGRTTQQRLGTLARAAPEARFVMVVELKATFFSHMNGRYRWDVDAVTSVAPREQTEQFEESRFGMPAFMTWDHQRELAAVAESARLLSEDIGTLLDRALGGAGETTTEPAADSGPAGDAQATPDAIYFVMVDRFDNGDPSNDVDADLADPQAFHGGDLAGLVRRLDYLQALGVGAIWLSPVFAMRTEKLGEHGAFHGYWVADFGAVESRFGTKAELVALRDGLRERGMGLYLDVVLNHVGYDTPLVKGHPEWFHGKGDITDWDDAAELTTHDVHGLPDLDQSQEAVYAYLMGHSKAWIDLLQPEGFRLDAVKHVDVAFWRRFNAELRAYAGPDFVVLGEMLDGDAVKLAALAESGGFNALFDFPNHFAMVDVFCHDKPVSRLMATLSLGRLYPPDFTAVNLLDNHDLPRILTVCGGDTARVARAVRWMNAMGGRPSYTWATEIGAEGGGEPDNRADMRFDQPAHPVGEAIRSSLALRRASRALSTGHTAIVGDAPDGVAAVVRWTGKDVALAAFNQGSEPASIRLPRWLRGQLAATAPVVIEAGQVSVFPLTATQQIIGPPKGEATITFAFEGAPGAVAVVGAAPELGTWRPEVAPTQDARGITQTTLPGGALYEFKLVARQRDGTWRWESGANRSLWVDYGQAEQHVSLRWRG